MNPQQPIYIPSKGRARIAQTPRFFNEIGVPYRIVVEAQEFDEYAEQWGEDRLIVLDPEYQRAYDTFWPIPEGSSPGSGPVRNFIWDHSISEGHDWHWCIDDNIVLFARLHQNQRVTIGDGTAFHAMESFCARYSNVAMGGPSYWNFTHPRAKFEPFSVGTRIYSCNLIRNSVPLRWRGRYNEDTDLSLRMLKSGWATILFNAFIQDKRHTQSMPGGNTDAFYASEGTLPKSKMLVAQHPDVARLAWRFGRWHHFVNYDPWRSMRLVRDPDVEIPNENPYSLTLKPRTEDRIRGGKRPRDPNPVPRSSTST